MLTKAGVDHKRVTVTTFPDHVKISGPEDARQQITSALLDRHLACTPTPQVDEWRQR
jgi:hypothetical protein